MLVASFQGRRLCLSSDNSPQLCFDLFPQTFGLNCVCVRITLVGIVTCNSAWSSDRPIKQTRAQLCVGGAEGAVEAAETHGLEEWNRTSVPYVRALELLLKQPVLQ